MIDLTSKYGKTDPRIQYRPPEFRMIDELDDPLRPSKGILTGLFIALVIWAGLMAAWFLAV